jgi:hypothetical protein
MATVFLQHSYIILTVSCSILSVFLQYTYPFPPVPILWLQYPTVFQEYSHGEHNCIDKGITQICMYVATVLWHVLYVAHFSATYYCTVQYEHAHVVHIPTAYCSILIEVFP